MKFFLLKNKIFFGGGHFFLYSMYSIIREQEKVKLNIRLLLFFFGKIYIKNRKTLNLKTFINSYIKLYFGKQDPCVNAPEGRATNE